MKSMYPALKYLLLNYSPQPMLMFLKKNHYARKLKSFSEDDEPELKVVSHLVSKGDHVVDIGSNVGVYTKFLSRMVGEKGRVYSIEPMPETYSILSSNIRKLKLSNVTPINKAVSDSTRRVTMSVPHYHKGADNYYRARITETSIEDQKSREVWASRLDDLFGDDLYRFSFVKCDIEGHELSCIRGAGAFLQKADACWLMEVSSDPDEPGSDASHLFQEMTSSGYAAWHYDGMYIRRRKPGDACLNYFFLRDRHATALRSRAGHLFGTWSLNE